MKVKVPRLSQLRYKHTILLLISIPIVFWVMQTPWAAGQIAQVESLGLFGAFILGMFCVSAFTIIPAGIVLYHLALHTDPVLMAIFAGLGGLAGDFIILRFIKDQIFEELRPLAKLFLGPWFDIIRRSRMLKWLLPVIGAVIVASPFPDEIGIGLMGLSHLKDWHFMLIIFVLDTVGMYLFAITAQAIGG